MNTWEKLFIDETDRHTPVFYDTETCGLHGIAVLIQVHKGDVVDQNDVYLHEVFLRPAQETIDLIDWLMLHTVVGFNLTFDHFHLCKLRTIFAMLDDTTRSPLDILPEIFEKEKLARDGKCLKPESACDLLVLASEGKHAALMLEHNELRIRAVPSLLSKQVAGMLSRHLQFPDVFFARKKDPTERFKVFPNKRAGFDDLVLKFAPSSALKALVTHFFGRETETLGDIGGVTFPPDKKQGYRPYGHWHEYIEEHVNYWNTNQAARAYAAKDVLYTYMIWEQFGRPEGGDVNSVLACMVGAVRWHGFMVDMEKVQVYIEDCASRMDEAPRAPVAAMKFLLDALDPVEVEFALILNTKKQTLEDLMEVYVDHLLGERAAAILDARRAKYDHDMCRKLMEAGRFHAASKVVGTLSGRKSGAGGDFNSQGISKKKTCREIFTFKWPGMVLCGGDFASQEITIAEAVFKDPQMHDDLVSGVKLHGTFGTFCFPGNTYDDIIATDGTENDLYKKSKSAVFLTLYGGTPSTFKRRLNISLEIATQAFERFLCRFPKMREVRQGIFDDFTMMTQPDGSGTQVIVQPPKKLMVESMFGFKRDFQPEFKVVGLLTDFANDIPAELKRYDHEIMLQRRKGRRQTPSGCLRSSLYLAAFGIQGGIQRAANNHVIQSTGASVCKQLEEAIWDLQPEGFTDWCVAPLNLHDEVMVVCKPELVDKLTATVKETVDEMTKKVPLLAIDWKNNLESWAS